MKYLKIIKNIYAFIKFENYFKSGLKIYKNIFVMFNNKMMIVRINLRKTLYF
jgi:hypothetical protein